MGTRLMGHFFRNRKQSVHPFLNRMRLRETVSTDTIFSKIRDVSGSWCAQIFYGLSSHYINVYGMKAESEGLEALQDFLREEGFPSII